MSETLKFKFVFQTYSILNHHQGMNWLLFVASKVLWTSTALFAPSLPSLPSAGFIPTRASKSSHFFSFLSTVSFPGENKERIANKCKQTTPIKQPLTNQSAKLAPIHVGCGGYPQSLPREMIKLLNMMFNSFTQKLQNLQTRKIHIPLLPFLTSSSNCMFEFGEFSWKNCALTVLTLISRW